VPRQLAQNLVGQVDYWWWEVQTLQAKLVIAPGP
jgi:hypothetical protein